MEQIFIKNIKINKVRHLKNLDLPVCENKCKHIILTGQNDYAIGTEKGSASLSQ